MAQPLRYLILLGDSTCHYCGDGTSCEMRSAPHDASLALLLHRRLLVAHPPVHLRLTSTSGLRLDWRATVELHTSLASLPTPGVLLLSAGQNDAADWACGSLRTHAATDQDF